MKINRLILFLIIAVTSLAAQAPDLKVFGLEIGAPLALPECAKYPIKIAMYAKNQNAWCWEFNLGYPRSKMEAAVPANDIVMINYPDNDGPQLVSAPPIIATIRDGKIDGIGFTTAGVRDVASVLQSLINKYGKPTKQESMQVQNLAGAKFDSVNALWELPGLTVELRGTDGTVDKGAVIIETPIRRAARLEREKNSAGRAL